MFNLFRYHVKFCIVAAEEPEALSLTLDVNGQYQFRADNGPGE